MPTHERLGTDDRESPQGRRKPSVQLDQEPAIIVGEPDPTLVCTENLNPDVVVMKSAKDGV